MAKAHLSNAAISKKGHLLYDLQLRSTVETEENIGKIILFDVETGHYEIDADGIQPNKRLRDRYPDLDPYRLFAIRIGYNAVFAVGSSLTRTARK